MSTSYWIDSAELPQRQPLQQDLTVDVAVVGAGIAGISTAWELARLGKSVALIESGRVVEGTTGFTTAKLTAQHALIYHDLTTRFGVDAAHIYASAQQSAIDLVARTSVELAIECDLERAAAITYTVNPDRVGAIADEVTAACSAGLKATLVEDQLHFGAVAGVRVEDQAQFHPRKYLRGLLADFESHGGEVFERTRVTGMNHGSPRTLSTSVGATVTAQTVVLATHYPILDRTLLFPRLTVRGEWVVAGPIAQADDPDGMFITTDDATRSVRTAPLTSAERLLIVTGEAFHPGDEHALARVDRLREWAVRTFPAWRETHRWSAHDTTSSDGMPFVGQLNSSLFVATGFGGWGMTNGIHAGHLIAQQIAGSPDEAATKLFDPRRIDLVAELSPVVRAGIGIASHFVGDRFKTALSGADSSPEPGSADVVRVGTQWVARYCDDAGDLHCVSARCTHLGCLVAFNDADRLWECPCHGSRFGTDGAVLHGPATDPLRPVRLTEDDARPDQRQRNVRSSE